jgi:hypothetical protein
MRTVKLSVPPDRTAAVLEIAFAAGIESATVHKAEVHAKDAKSVQREVIDLDISTPKAKAFLDRLLASDVYDRNSFSIVIKQPRSIVSRSDEQELTEPLEEPGVDLLAELWQFSHITYGLVGRILISAILLAHGLIEQNILFMIAGLLFLPVLPMLMAISLGALTRRWRLAAQGIGALLIAIALLFTGGAVAAAVERSASEVQRVRNTAHEFGYLDGSRNRCRAVDYRRCRQARVDRSCGGVSDRDHSGMARRVRDIGTSEHRP